MPFEIPGGGAQMINLGEMMGKAFGGTPLKRRKINVRSAWDKLVEEEADKRLDQDESAASRWRMPRPTASSSSTRSTRSPCRTCAADR
jgi:ATP-dependent protease HslVU (ClpYQ) ATPase subunit